MTDKPARHDGKTDTNHHPAIAAMLAAGRLEVKTPSGWRAADLGLRYEIIDAVLKSPHVGDIHAALLGGRPIQFREVELDMIMRWSPD